MDAMAALERQARAPVGFVAASSAPKALDVVAERVDEVEVANPDALNIDLDHM